MQIITATLLGMPILFVNCPSNVQEMQVMQCAKTEDDAFLSLLKPYMATRTYTSARANMVDAVEKASGVKRGSLAEAPYFNSVRKSILEGILPTTDVPATSDELENAMKLVEQKLAEFAGDTLTFDFNNWETTPSERTFGGVRKPSKDAIDKAELYLAKIRSGKSSFEQFNAAMSAHNIAPVEDGESVVTDMARALVARTRAIEALDF